MRNNFKRGGGHSQLPYSRQTYLPVYFCVYTVIDIESRGERGYSPSLLQAGDKCQCVGYIVKSHDAKSLVECGFMNATTDIRILYVYTIHIVCPWIILHMYSIIAVNAFIRMQG